METLGEHIRNILGPYSNLVQILSDIRKYQGTETEKMLKNFLFEMDLQNLKENLKHFIEVSKLDEVENINWRSTKLFEEYSKRHENDQ